MDNEAVINPRASQDRKSISALMAEGARGMDIRKLAKAWALILLIAAGIALDSGDATAQGPGDLPPAQAIRGTGNAEWEDANGIPVSAFMFLDESGVPSVIRGMSYERYLELDSGNQSNNQIFNIASMQITGRVSGDRAEMDIRMRITVNATKGRLEPIPIKLSNFHLLKSAEFTSNPAGASSNDTEYLTEAPDGGYVLWVRSEKKRTLTAKMTMSAKVEKDARHNLLFRLPIVSTKINLRTDIADAKAEIFGDEYIHPPKKAKDGGTAFEIESRGGAFTVYWNPREKQAETTPRLEVDGTIALNLSQDSDPLTLKVGLDVRNLRGPVSTFDMELPKGAKVIEGTAVLAANKLPLSISAPSRNNGVTVTIPKVESKQRVAIAFDLQLPRNDNTSGNRWNISVPKLIGAIKHQGEIQVQTGSESRLRWQKTDSVRKRLGEKADDGSDERLYQFKYVRSGFTLPLWLSKNQRQLQLSCDSQIKITNSTAQLETEIRFTGQTNENLTLRLDMADWQLLDVMDAETDEPLLREMDGSIVSVDMNLETDAPPPIRIVAERRIDSEVTFSIPRVVNADNNLVVRNSTASLQSTGRSAFVVSLPELQGAEPVSLSRADESASTMLSRFRLSRSGDAKIVGSLVQQPPQITLASNAEVALSGDRLTTKISWTVDPRFDLGGSLPVRVPGFVDDDAVQIANAFVETAGSVQKQSVGWVVRVNDSVAKLKSMGGERYELVSPLLGSESANIRWEEERTVSRSSLDTEVQTIDLPSPALADVSIRGDINVNLSGDASTGLYAVDSPSANQMQFQSLPEQIRIRLAKQTTEKDELSIRRAVLRTAFGSMTRHEQLLALVQGGNALRVNVPGGTDNLVVEAFVDRVTARVSRTADSLIVALPGSGDSHLVDLRVWMDEPSQSMVANIKPTLVLPVGVSRTYWQVNSPRDSHLVWASPVVERAMNWKFGRWDLSREVVRNDTSLAEWVGAQNITSMPPGNQYLYVGSDVQSFHARSMTRPWLWFIVGGFVLGVAWMLTHMPSTRSPFTAVAAAILYTGLLAIAPDAAVLAGQWAMVGLVLVVVMFAVKALLAPAARNRILRRAATPVIEEASTRAAQVPNSRHDSKLPVTHSMDAGASPSEVSS